MNLTHDDAHLLFRRWRDHTTPVEIKLLSPALIFDATGIITDSAFDSLGLRGDSWRLTIPLSDAEFSFSDPREIAVASVREAETARYEFGVAVHLPSGDLLSLLELKRDQEDGR